LRCPQSAPTPCRLQAVTHWPLYVSPAMRGVKIAYLAPSEMILLTMILLNSLLFSRKPVDSRIIHRQRREVGSPRRR
jgi:hypothetical protein